MFMKTLAKITKCLILVITQLKSKYDDSNKLIVDTMKYETGGASIKELLDWSQKCIHFW